MPTLYGTGSHRVIYKAEGFVTGLTVTAYFWNPSLTKSALQTFIEISDGLYYLDYTFTPVGAHGAKFYEGGTGTIAGTFRIVARNDISVADIIAGIKDGGFDLQEMMRCIFSACCLLMSGGGTNTLKSRDSADTKNRITKTVDANGNTTAVTLDVS